MKTHLLFLFILLLSLPMFAQTRLMGVSQNDINPSLLQGRWKARWISVPDEAANTYGVYHFRKSFSLDTLPERFLVHVTADNRYKLFLNGTMVSLGPARGDVYNWSYETVDLSPWLQKGTNVLAAEVWNFAEQKPLAQVSFNQTGFLMQGNSATEEVVNTDASWLCTINKAYAPWWKPVHGYYAVGACEQLDAALYPWGWEQPRYDDAGWKKARAGMEGAAKGARDYPGRLLVPRPIPPMEMKTERFQAVRRAQGITCPKDFPQKKVALHIPAHTEAVLLLDQKQLTTGYLTLLFSKGKGAEIRITYAEAMYEDKVDKTTKSYSLPVKGHRDSIEGKKMIGYEDRLLPDGGDGRSFTSLWWRTWRYVQLTITTAGEPLVVDDLYGTFTGYPFKQDITFAAPALPELNEMLSIGWRTARLCANETYMDCPYYEQLQYFGDTRIQALVTMFNTRDTFMVKNALEQGRQSIVADGITMSRYPSYLHQFISSFSLWWICMGHDYWMYRGDEAYLKSLLPAYRGILSWYEQYLKPDASLAYVPHWFFADWSDDFPNGEPIREKEGNSAFQDLMYILTLDAAAPMEERFGMPSMAGHYREIATAMRNTIRAKYWNEAKGLFADTYEQKSYSQHVNSLAVLADVVKGDEAARVMSRCLADTSLAQATIYFRYYVHNALNKAGMGDQLLDNLQIWRDQMALGLTTWAEMPEPSRSDCHAWGASPNIEFYRILLGIDSADPGFRKIRIAPSLGNLKDVSGSMPHPAGKVAVSYKIGKKGDLQVRIELPAGTSGTFVWKGAERELNEGISTFSIP
ncbi:alpha-L-rhamnosidase-related protein [Macellibacteroides fermentans]|uniref:alpha-L-rhamnosidase-related protein n=1 Tax=Macellibacteroides fermentans TaxID=879969 RepID=UPI002B382A72|nr:alpha-L-rhamnosidase C-terminal domain-containing protein [Macellibacteroides fermentans]